MRTVTLIIIHCSAVRPNQLSSAKDITNGTRLAVGAQSAITMLSVVTEQLKTADLLNKLVPTA